VIIRVSMVFFIICLLLVPTENANAEERSVFVPIVPHTKNWNGKSARLMCSFYNSTPFEGVVIKKYKNPTYQPMSLPHERLTIRTLGTGDKGADIFDSTKGTGILNQGTLHQYLGLTLHYGQSFSYQWSGPWIPKGLFVTARSSRSYEDRKTGTVSGSCVYWSSGKKNAFTFSIPVNGGNPF